MHFGEENKQNTRYIRMHKKRAEPSCIYRCFVVSNVSLPLILFRSPSHHDCENEFCSCMTMSTKNERMIKTIAPVKKEKTIISFSLWRLISAGYDFHYNISSILPIGTANIPNDSQTNWKQLMDRRKDGRNWTYAMQPCILFFYPASGVLCCVLIKDSVSFERSCSLGERLRTTRRSRGGAARGGGTPSSTSKAPGSSARWRTSCKQISPC